MRSLRLMLSTITFLACLLLAASPSQAVCSGAANGTATTLTTLMTSWFVNGRAAGAITPDCIRDLAASTYGSANNNLNLKNYGLPTGGDDTAAINAVLAAALPASFSVTASMAPGLILLTSASTASGTTLPFTSTTGVVVGALAVAVGGGTAGGAYVVSIVANTSVTLSAAITATIPSGASINFNPTLTVTAASGTVKTGLNVQGTGVPIGQVVQQATSGSGGAGAYALSLPATLSSQTMTMQPPSVVAVYAPAGIYNHAGLITVNGVRLYGDGPATEFHSTDLANDCDGSTGPCNALLMRGFQPEIENIKATTAWLGPRMSNGSASCIFIDGTDFATSYFHVNSTILLNCASGGVLNSGSSFGIMENSRVEDTQADAFHNCCGAGYVTVANNVSIDAGDDCYPVVSYTGNPVVAHDIAITGNRCDISSARGLVVSGGSNITFTGNTVSGALACIFIGTESGYLTTTSVTATGNTCTGSGSRAGTILANVQIPGTSAAIPVKDIKITNNVISSGEEACLIVGSATAVDSVVNVDFSHNTCRGLANSNSAYALYIRGVTNLRINGNDFADWSQGGLVTIPASNNSGTLMMNDNTFTNMNVSNGAGARVADIETDSWSRIIIRNNTEIDGSHPLANFFFITGCGVCIIDGNIGQTASQSVAGITSGFFSNSAMMGTFTCASSAATIANSQIAASSKVTTTLKTVGGTVAAVLINTITPGTGFHVTCGASDTSTYNYTFVN